MGYYRVPESVSKKGLWRSYRKINNVVHQKYHATEQEAREEDMRLAEIQAKEGCRDRLEVVGWGELGLRYTSISFNKVSEDGIYCIAVRVQVSNEFTGQHICKDFPVFQYGPDECMRLAGETIIDALNLKKSNKNELNVIRKIRQEAKKEIHIERIWHEAFKTDLPLTFFNTNFKLNGAVRGLHISKRELKDQSFSCNILVYGKKVGTTEKISRMRSLLFDREFYNTLAEMTAHWLRMRGIKESDERFMLSTNNIYFANSQELLAQVLQHHTLVIDGTMNIFKFQTLVLRYYGAI